MDKLLGEKDFLSPRHPLSQLVQAYVEMPWLTSAAQEAQELGLIARLQGLSAAFRGDIESFDGINMCVQQAILPRLADLEEFIPKSKLSEELKFQARERMSATQEQISRLLREFSPIHSLVQEVYLRVYREFLFVAKNGEPKRFYQLISSINRERISYFLEPNDETLATFQSLVRAVIEDYKGEKVLRQALEALEDKLISLEAAALFQGTEAEAGIAS